MLHGEETAYHGFGPVGDPHPVSELQGKCLALIPVADFLRRRPDLRHFRSCDPGLDQINGLPEPVATLFEYIGLSLGGLSADKGLVIACLVSIKDIHHVDVDHVPGPDDAIREIMGMGMGPVPGDHVYILYLLGPEPVHTVAHHSRNIALLDPGMGVVDHLPKGGLNNGYGHLNEFDLFRGLDDLGLEQCLLAVHDLNPLFFKGLDYRHFYEIDSYRLSGHPEFLEMGGDHPGEFFCVAGDDLRRECPPHGSHKRKDASLHPGAEGLLGLDSAPNLEENRLIVCSQKAASGQLVVCPVPQAGARDIPDGVRIKAKKGPQSVLFQLFIGLLKTILSELCVIDSDFTVRCHGP